MIYDSFTLPPPAPNENYHKENVSFRLGKQRRRVEAKKKSAKAEVNTRHREQGTRRSFVLGATEEIFVLACRDFP